MFYVSYEDAGKVAGKYVLAIFLNFSDEIWPPKIYYFVVVNGGVEVSVEGEAGISFNSKQLLYIVTAFSMVMINNLASSFL